MKKDGGVPGGANTGFRKKKRLNTTKKKTEAKRLEARTEKQREHL